MHSTFLFYKPIGKGCFEHVLDACMMPFFSDSAPDGMEYIAVKRKGWEFKPNLMHTDQLIFLYNHLRHHAVIYF
jgi:hypothetical protein